MLDKNRIRLMAKMAAYEKEHAAEDIRISSYYRKDYTGMHTLATVLWVTFGYVVAAAFFALCILDTLLADLTFGKLVLIVSAALGGYLVLLVVYCVYAAMYYKAKHNDAKQRVKKYYRDLSRLEKAEVKEKR